MSMNMSETDFFGPFRRKTKYEFETNKDSKIFTYFKFLCPYLIYLKRKTKNFLSYKHLEITLPPTTSGFTRKLYCWLCMKDQIIDVALQALHLCLTLVLVLPSLWQNNHFHWKEKTHLSRNPFKPKRIAFFLCNKVLHIYQ